MESLEPYLTCPICMTLFDHTPVTLNCLHSFCGFCLLQFILTNVRQRQAQLRLEGTDNIPDDITFSCPICRGDIKSARPNTDLGKILEEFYAKFPDKKNPDADPPAVAWALNRDLEVLMTIRHARELLRALRAGDGGMWIHMKPVSRQEYQERRREGRGGGMVWREERREGVQFGTLLPPPTPATLAPSASLSDTRPQSDVIAPPTEDAPGYDADNEAEPDERTPRRRSRNTRTAANSTRNTMYFVMDSFQYVLPNHDGWSLIDSWVHWDRDTPGINGETQHI